MASAIRFVALVAKQPDDVAAFYKTYLGMRELSRSASGNVTVTDGFYNLTFLKQHAPEQDQPTGLSHFGIHVDDIGEIETRLREFAPDTKLRPGSGDLYQGDYVVDDPAGLEVRLSTRRFGAPDETAGLPSIRHMALAVPKHEEVLSFYVQVFGFRETRTSLDLRRTTSTTRFFGDGHTSVAILRDRVTRRVSGEPVDERRMHNGLNHIGILVADLTGTLQSLPASAAADRPVHGPPMAEYRAYDPEGNGFDLSQEKGYEVDLDVWERLPALIRA